MLVKTQQGTNGRKLRVKHCNSGAPEWRALEKDDCSLKEKTQKQMWQFFQITTLRALPPHSLPTL